MPLTAVRPDDTVLDATVCTLEAWNRVHRAAPRADLRCRDCGGRLHAKVSPLGNRFFAHDDRQTDCDGGGETAEHRTLKEHIAHAVRLAGGEAHIEAFPSPTDTGGWRADVLAVGPDGHRVAFEVQLSPMTVDVGEQRSRRYAADGIQTVWVTDQTPHWLHRLPGVRVEVINDFLYVFEGVAVRSAASRSEYGTDSWDTVHGRLTKILPRWLRGELTTVTAPILTTKDPRTHDRCHRHGAVVWATRTTVAAGRVHSGNAGSTGRPQQRRSRRRRSGHSNVS
jgi:competence protein CoiA